MSISKLTAAFASATNETTLALASLNLDFSLLKVEPPKEFLELGSALSSQRRSSAEDGAAHRTARRLGALFEGLAPTTPLLIQAYGQRASSILKDVQDTGGIQERGVFADCVGADATSVWAAATSGASAIAIHLLACMLARTWTVPQATSIWVEIVEDRKHELQERIKSGLVETSVQIGLAASQGLSRADLAQWDASARSWLQVADDVEKRRYKQLMLIINNVDLPVNQGSGSTYSRVIQAWQTAMTALEKLIQGQHQRTSQGAVLLGLASWHIYPDLEYLADKPLEIKFDDKLVRGGRLTIGLENPDPDVDEGLYWSLSLAHLRFYGDPVTVNSFTTRDASRVSIEELHYVALGSLLAHWGDAGLDVDPAARFLVALDEVLTPRIHWIHILADASRRLLDMQSDERNTAISLVALGRRRGSRLLAEKKHSPPPMLGLSNPWIFTLMSQENLGLERDLTHRTSVSMMRYIAKKLDLRHNQCIISNCTTMGTDYTTAIPHSAPEEDWTGHMKWIRTDSNVDRSCRCHETGHGCHSTRCMCMIRNVICTENCHRGVTKNAGSCPGCNRLNQLDMTHDDQSYGLGCDNVSPGERVEYVTADFFHIPRQEELNGLSSWDIGAARTTSNRKQHYRSPASSVHSIRLGKNHELCPCFHERSGRHGPIFSHLAGDLNGAALFIRRDVDVRAQRSRVYSALVEAAADAEKISLEDVTIALKDGTLRPANIHIWMNVLHSDQTFSFPSFGPDLSVHDHHVELFMRSIHGLELATEVYEELAGSTISLSLISRPLHTACWVPDYNDSRLSRPGKFSCIAMFESGSFNLDPGDLGDVIAISSRNSLFISEVLLNDPFSQDHADSITRVVGNVGRAGIVLMVAPPEPRVRKPELNNWSRVAHAPFDGRLEDSYSATSLHLAFTEFEIPFNLSDRGSIDTELCLVETLVQVFDRQKWVADLDVLALFRGQTDLVRRYQIQCTGCQRNKALPRSLTSFDNWDELLDVPETLGKDYVGVVRAHDNWLGRLAAASVCLQKGFRLVILPPSTVCWHCLCRNNWHWQKETVRRTMKAAAPFVDSGILEEHFGEENESDYDSDDSVESVVTAQQPGNPTQSSTIDSFDLYQRSTRAGKSQLPQLCIA